MYKQVKVMGTEDIAPCVFRLADEAVVPFDPANTDYSNFKKEVLNGAELQDADGNVMTQEEATAFIGTLP